MTGLKSLNRFCLIRVEAASRPCDVYSPTAMSSRSVSYAGTGSCILETSSMNESTGPHQRVSETAISGSQSSDGADTSLIVGSNFLSLGLCPRSTTRVSVYRYGEADVHAICLDGPASGSPKRCRSSLSCCSSQLRTCAWYLMPVRVAVLGKIGSSGSIDSISYPCGVRKPGS